jgi:uncharacterized protein YbbK (DUF523 family)
LQSGGYVWIRGPAESNVTVTDLNEAEIFSVLLWSCGSEDLGDGNASGEAPDDAGACPRHAMEKSSAVDAV